MLTRLLTKHGHLEGNLFNVGWETVPCVTYLRASKMASYVLYDWWGTGGIVIHTPGSFPETGWLCQHSNNTPFYMWGW
jgi:hypothetical protein